jgi:outer membrane biosynthesis protein TonB
MRWSLTISVILHAAILLAAFVVLPNPTEFKVEDQESIPVDIVSIEDLSKRQATAKVAEEPKPQEKIAPKPAEVIKDVKPAPEVAPEIKTAVKEPTAEPEPKPEVKPEEPKKVEAKPDEKKPEDPKKAEAKPEEKQPDPKPLEELIKETNDKPPEPAKEEVKKAEAKPEIKPKDKPKPERKKPPKEFNPDEIAAFLNKTDDKHTAPLKPTEEQGSPKKGEFNLSGADDSIAATLNDMLIKRLAGCWTIPPGAREAQINVKVHFYLNSDGTVNGYPDVMNGNSDPLFQATAQSAVSAVMECQAYDFFPADKYDLWRENTVNFNPNQMFPS